MIVCKFGGTCTAYPTAIKNIKTLLEESKERKVFVFSAIGKENKQDTKMTDLLIKFADEENREKTKEKILGKFEKLLKTTGVKFNIIRHLNKTFDEYLKTNDKEKLLSRGEYFTTFIMAKYLNIKFVPAEKILFFDGEKIDFQKSKERLEYYLNKYKRITVPGFYFCGNGRIKLFSRGGGDVSGAFCATLSNATIYENWTDVGGIFGVNPNILKTKPIKTLSYHDLEFMTAMDANVVHAECAKILNDTKTKLCVKSIFEPQNQGTEISQTNKNSSSYICYKMCDDFAKIFVCERYDDYRVILASRENYKETIKSLYENQ